MGIASSTSFDSFFGLIVILALAVIAAGIIAEQSRERLKSDTSILVGRERNEALREVASARLTASEQAESAKAATLEAAEVKLNYGELSSKYEASQEALAVAIARIEELEQNGPTQAQPEKPAGVSFVIGADGELGDPTFSEEVFDDSASIIFHEEDEVPVS